MTYWYVEENTGIRYTDQVPETAWSWGRCDERGVYYFRTETAAQECVDRFPVKCLIRTGTIVRMV